MEEEWLADKILEMTKALARIESKVDRTNGSVISNQDKIRRNSKRLRELEDSKLVKDTEEKFHKKHPYVTAGGVTVGGMSLITFAYLILKLILENWPG